MKQLRNSLFRRGEGCIFILAAERTLREADGQRGGGRGSDEDASHHLVQVTPCETNDGKVYPLLS